MGAGDEGINGVKRGIRASVMMMGVKMRSCRNACVSDADMQLPT